MATLGGGNISYQNGIYDCFRIAISQGFARLAVPIFFLTAGYLFFQKLEKWNWQVYTDKIKKRINTLLVPYLIWNVIAIVYFLAIFLYKNDIGSLMDFLDERGGLLWFWNCGRAGYVPRVNLFGWEMWDGAFPINYPLWFVRDLMVVCVLSPVIWFLVNRLKVFWIILMLILYIADIWIPLEGFRAEGFFFFSAGAYLCIWNKDFKSVLSDFKKYAFPVSIVALILCVISYGEDWHWYVRRIFCIFGTITALYTTLSLIEKGRYKIMKPNAFLSEASFVIFAAHIIGIKDIVCSVINRIIEFVMVNVFFIRDLMFTIGYIIAPIVTTLLILIVYWYASKKMPGLCNILTGGRNVTRRAV